jgi:signal transduction histidine kinase
MDPAAWRSYVVVLLVLVTLWPFHIELAEGVEIYLPAMWTSSAAAYLLGAPILATFWASTVLGFVLIVVLDGLGLVPATGITADTIRQVRGQPCPADTAEDGHLRQFLNLASHGIRVATATSLAGLAPALPASARVLVAEGAVAAWMQSVPIPGRMAPRRSRARVVAALGADILLPIAFLHLTIVWFLLLCHHTGGLPAFVAASFSTLGVHALLKRLSDTRRESERRRTELEQMRDALARRERLAAIGQTAATVFHQIGRQHGAIGMFGHLLARMPQPEVREHAGQILASVDEANRVVDELLRFSEDRVLNLYPHSLAEIVAECVSECRARAAARGIELRVVAAADATIALDKHKLRQAVGNLLDNAIDASPAGAAVEVTTSVQPDRVSIVVRDHGDGVAKTMRERLFTPFATSKPQGIGLGLVLAREVVEAHGGELTWQACAPGTAFALTLPRRDAA